MIKEIFKEYWKGLLLGLIALIASLFWKGIVGELIYPQIKEELTNENYLREEIKQGKFVSTTEDEFVKNHPISSQRLTELKNQLYVRNTEIEQLKTYLEKQHKIYQEQLSQQQKVIVKLTARQKELNNHLAGVDKIVDVLSTKRLEVLLFISTRDADRGMIILNGQNQAIFKTIKHGEDYVVSSPNGKTRELEARVETIHAPGLSDDFSMGRIHSNDYDKLFNGSSGIAKAQVLLED
ncbi:hypothetical protein BCT41_25090 [Vibrio splendidus]|uniref:hypothetical protein n=2 Tax=Vibrio TaxID=662 RepID=UPI000C81BC4A|nr:hypothetical protein [Vibrio splendidus]PMN12383.1 hypothetical protein BCT41_25090 [Vibrio splendidus]